MDSVQKKRTNQTSKQKKMTRDKRTQHNTAQDNIHTINKAWWNRTCFKYTYPQFCLCHGLVCFIIQSQHIFAIKAVSGDSSEGRNGASSIILNSSHKVFSTQTFFIDTDKNSFCHNYNDEKKKQQENKEKNKKWFNVCTHIQADYFVLDLLKISDVVFRALNSKVA